MAVIARVPGIAANAYDKWWRMAAARGGVGDLGDSGSSAADGPECCVRPH